MDDNKEVKKSTIFSLVESFVLGPPFSTAEQHADGANAFGGGVPAHSKPIIDPNAARCYITGKFRQNAQDIGETLLKDILTVIVTAIEERPNDMTSVETERTLDSMAICVKRRVSKNVSKESWFELLTQATLKLAWVYSWDPKLLKKMIKVITEMEKHDSDVISKHLEPYSNYLKFDISRDQLNKWYNLVEVSGAARKIFHGHFTRVLGIINFQLNEVHYRNQFWTVDRQKWLQLLLKVTIQLFQFISQRVHDAVWNHDYTSNTNATKEMGVLVSHICRIVTSQSAPQHCLPLAGTALGFLVCLADETTASKTFIDLYYGLGQCSVIPIGHLEVTSLEENSSARIFEDSGTSMGHLNLITGLLTCAKAELLWQDIDRPGTDKSLLVVWLFHRIVSLCNMPEHQYHSFKLFTSWYQRFAKSFTKISEHTDQTFFPQGSAIVQGTLDLVLTHLDSPVEGVNDSVMEAFRLLLEMNELETNYLRPRGVQENKLPVGQADGQDVWNLAEEVLTHALSLPWTLKGKHGLISILVKYTDYQKLVLSSTSGHIFKDLLDCLATNHLAPASTLVYRAILLQLNSEDNTEGFQEHCLPWLIQGLTSDYVMLRNNTNHYWLSVTLKNAPNTFPLILAALESRKSNYDNNTYLMHGLMAVLKTGRSHNLLKETPKDLVRQAFQHQDDDIRLDAFGVICVSQKKAEPLSQDEFELLREYLPHNMTNDSAPFRQQLQASLRAMLVRLRDSSIASIRVNKSQPTKDAMDALEFLDWIWSLLMESLFPGASYQRLKSSLDWILLVLDTFTYQPHRRQRKGTTPESVSQLMKIAASQGLCQFYSAYCVRIVLACLLHGTDEIRNLTAETLLRFYQWPLELEYPTEPHQEIPPMTASRGHQLLQTGLRLCNSAKAHESESGALIISMIFQKLIVDQGMGVSLSYKDGRFTVAEGVTGEDDTSYRFLNQMVDLIAQSLEMTRENVLQGAKQTPIHGFLLAIRKCLSLKCVKYEKVEMWRPLFLRLINVISSVYDMVLEVLGGKVHSKDTAPSFEQMGMAITATIAESSGEEAGDDLELLTNDHRVLMTWGWLNIKEASILLGSLVEYVPLTSGEETGILTREEVVEIGQTFLKILTQCRHRGAIEGCNLGLAQYCEQLLLSPVSEFHQIPGSLLDKVLEQITRNDVNLSVTRRSAGLPLIITSIVNSESKTRQSSLLSKVVSTLLSISSLPVVEGDQRADKPQVHAMNILKAIMKEASVAMAARKYLAQAVIVAIHGFASPHWAVRNAAMQLYGTLVTRLLGQKHTRGETHSNLMTVAEFFAHYPTLEEFFLSHLEASAAHHKSSSRGGLHLHPSTFPVLSLFARLGSGTETHTKHREDRFRVAVEQFLSSAVMAIREVAARSMVGLIPVNKIQNHISQIINRLPEMENNVLHYNRLHGDLILCRLLLSKLESSAIDHRQDYIDELMTAVSTRVWLASVENPCSVVRAEYLELIMSLISLSDSALPDTLTTTFTDSVNELLSMEQSHLKQTVGRERLLTPLIQWYLGFGGSNVNPDRLALCLSCSDPDILMVTLSSLTQHLDHFSPTFDWTSSQMRLWSLLLTRPDCTLASVILGTLIAIYKRHHSLGLDQGQVQQVWSYLMCQLSREKDSQLASHALYMSAVMMCDNLAQEPKEMISDCCELLSDCPHPLHSEILHISTAKSLQQIAPSVVEILKQANPSDVIIKLAIRMFHVGLKLLVNESSLVRKAAADFVTHYHSHLNNIQQVQPLQPTLALKELCCMTFKLLANSPTFISEILCEVRRKGSIATLVSQEAKPYVDELFEAEEANYYREDITLTSMLSECMKSSSLECLDDEQIQEIIKSVIQNLSDAETALSCNCSREGPVNVSLVQRVYESLWAELHVVSLLVLRLPEENIHRSNLKSLITSYSKMENLHPHMLFLLKQISNDSTDS